MVVCEACSTRSATIYCAFLLYFVCNHFDCLYRRFSSDLSVLRSPKSFLYFRFASDRVDISTSFRSPPVVVLPIALVSKDAAALDDSPLLSQNAVAPLLSVHSFIIFPTDSPVLLCLCLSLCLLAFLLGWLVNVFWTKTEALISSCYLPEMRICVQS